MLCWCPWASVNDLPHLLSLLTAVKKFPRKQRDNSASAQKKYQRELKLSKEKGGSLRKAKGKAEETVTNGTIASHGSPPKLPYSSVAVSKSPRMLESDGEEVDLEHLKFNVSSPESFMYSVLDSTVPQLFNYDSLENIHEKSGGSPETKHSDNLTRSGSHSNVLKVTAGGRDGMDVVAALSPPRLIKAEAGTSTVRRPNDEAQVLPGKRGPDLQATIQAKRQRLETALSNITPRQPVASFQAAVQAAAQQSLSQPASLLNSPESVAGAMSAYASQETTPYATPIGTPSHSPLPSPSHAHMFPSSSRLLVQSSPAPMGQPSHAGHMTFSTSSGLVRSPPPATSFSTVNPINLPGFCPQSSNILLPGQPNTIFLNSPFRVVPVAGSSLLPLVQLATPFSQQTLQLQETLGPPPQVQKSPFTVVPIPPTKRSQADQTSEVRER